MTDRCDGCRFWRRTDGDAGECRRRAPAPLVVPSAWTLEVHWPPMPAGEWCGDWQPLPLVQPSDQDRELARLREKLADADRAAEHVVALWRESHPGQPNPVVSVAIHWLLGELGWVRLEVARLSRAVVDGEGDEED